MNGSLWEISRSKGRTIGSSYAFWRKMKIDGKVAGRMKKQARKRVREKKRDQ